MRTFATMRGTDLNELITARGFLEQTSANFNPREGLAKRLSRKFRRGDVYRIWNKIYHNPNA